jgi:hypothetical protein
MTKKKKPLLKVTATLLNSWGYIFHGPPDYADQSLEDFLKYLHREITEPNFYMKRGIRFEQKCVNGEVPVISDIIKGGAFQTYVEKDIVVKGYDVRLLGYLDVLKEGIIYDIKRVNQYTRPKYFNSYQHHIYLECVPEAKEFHYLVAAGQKDDNVTLNIETYRQDEKQDLDLVIRQFFAWLEDNMLFDVYLENYNLNKEN